MGSLDYLNSRSVRDLEQSKKLPLTELLRRIEAG